MLEEKRLLIATEADDIVGIDLSITRKYCIINQNMKKVFQFFDFTTPSGRAEIVLKYIQI